MLKVLVLSLDILPCDNLWELHIVLLEMVCTAKCVLSVKPSPIFMISRMGASSENMLLFEGLRMPC